MQVTIQLCAGNILINDDKQERIIHVDNTFVVTVDLNTTKLIFNRYNPFDLMGLIRNHSVDIAFDDEKKS